MSPQAHQPHLSSTPGTAGAYPPGSGPSIPGLQLAPGEYIIAVERPVLMKWAIILPLMFSIVLIPLGLYYLFVRVGKVYAVTNRRVVRSDGPGKIQQIPLADLEGYRFKRDFFLRNTSILLLPRQGTPHHKVRFAMLTPGPDSSMARLWGALNFWVLTPWISPDEAPPVDATGKPLVSPPRIEVVVCDKTFLTAGLKILPCAGATVITPSRIVFFRAEPMTSGFYKVYPKLPVYAYVASKAAATNDLATFESQLDWIMSQDELVHHCFVWARCTDVSMGRMRSLTFKHDGTRCGVAIPKASAAVVTEFLRKYGIMSR